MKLVFVNRFFYPDSSATSQMLTDVAFYLASKEHNVHIVTSRLNYEGGDQLPCNETVNGVSIHRVWTTKFGRANLVGRAFDYVTFYLSAFFVLLLLLKRGDHVIAKTDPPLVSVPVGWAARIRGARQYNWLQDLFPEVAQELGMKIPGFLTGLLRWFRDASILKAENNIAIGELMRNKILKLGVGADRIVVIPNWADGEAIQPNRGLNPLRDTWHLRDKFVVGYSGNLGRAHEIETLLGVIRELKDEDNICFLFIGSGVLLDSLKKIANEEGLSNLIFKPYQPRELLPQSLTVPDVHITILRPELEGLIVPSKIYGVLAAGRPSIYIGDTQGEIGELVTTYNAGLVVQVGDVAGLNTAILRLRDDVADRESMGANARRYFDENLGIRRSLEMLEQILC
ncbi:MAG: glycosyltransferase family 4 protein [Gammaproteobacteria bacterium]|jgi:colanic acid biosynthesis glycosyl transferase WcaI|nr:glycosyltransferase family 4 protein [Gammaproteobacteria bacterium]MBT7372132.1 glycosyltransferase family 4 protein [Gammaproteobacteria bacterium]